MAMSRSLPTVEPRRIEVCEEFDSETRECHVWFYARPVSEVLPMKNTDGTPAIHLFHWSITVHFPRGDRYFTFEAFEEDDKLVATRTNGAPSHFCVQEYLGHKKTSPAEMLRLAQRNVYNNTWYDATLRNCQMWVKEFLKFIGVEMTSKVDKFKTYVEEKGVGSALVVSTLAKSGKSLYSARPALTAGNTGSALGFLSSLQNFKSY